MRFLLIRFLPGLLLALSLSLQAASIAEIDSLRLARQSQAAFQGEVLAIRAKESPAGRIYSFVDFQVQDVVFGPLQPGSVLTLRFTGGRVGDRQFSVGVDIPQPGERGIYFVESIDGGLINPLLGWAQGRFHIEDDGTLVAGNGEVVTGVGPVKAATALRLSRGVARGIETRPRGALQAQSRGVTRVQPMTVDAFKAVIRSLREGGKR